MSSEAWLYHGATFVRQRANRKYVVSYICWELVKRCEHHDIPHVHRCFVSVKQRTPHATHHWSYDKVLRNLEYNCPNIAEGIELYLHLENDKTFFNDYIESVLMESLL